MAENILFCLEHGVFTQADADRLLSGLAGRERIHRLADEYGITRHAMSYAALDAGLAFMRLCFLDESGEPYSPPAIPDCGWDELADNPAEQAFYEQLCHRYCDALGRPRMVLEHVRFTPAAAQAARESGAVVRTVAGLRGYGIRYVAAHWPTEGSVACEHVGNSCHAKQLVAV